MPTRPSATTRTTRSLVQPLGHGRELLGADEVVVATASRARYRVERLLGQGGFGQVFLVRRLSRSTTLPQKVCLSVSHRIDGWLREADFGLLLDDHPRAIRVFEAFPLVREHRGGHPQGAHVGIVQAADEGLPGQHRRWR